MNDDDLQIVVQDDAHLEQPARSVTADEHQHVVVEPRPDRMADGVEDVVVRDAVAASARQDDRIMHIKLP